MARSGAAQESALGRPGIWSSVLTDFPGWVAAPGRPGFTPSADRASDFPYVRAGLALGAWGIEDERRGGLELPWPGLSGMTPALAWSDSLRLGDADAPVRTGLGQPLATASGIEYPIRGRRTHAVVGSLFNGFDVREPVVWVARGDSMRRASISILSGGRDGTGSYGQSGRHLWSADMALRFGAHRVAGAYLQRAQAMELVSGERGSGSGASGFFDYGWQRAHWQFTTRAERGWDYQQSVAAVTDTANPTQAVLEPARRDAQRNRVAAVLEWQRGTGTVGLSGDWSNAEVRRDQFWAFRTRAQQWDVGAHSRSALGDGTLEASLDLAANDVVDRTVWSPAARYRVRSDAFDGGFSVARLAVPVWSDLALGQSAFLQDTWVGGIDAGTTLGTRAHLRMGAQLGRTTDRAVLFRLPIQELWLRSGAVADPERWTFGLYTLSAEWVGDRTAIRGEGFVLARDAHAIQPQVDPTRGARGEADWGFSAFQGDLGLTLRADAALVGSRESEALTPRRLDSYVTSSVSGIATLGDVMVTMRVANLENVRHEEPWIDLSTGREAVGAAREFRLSVTLRLED